MIYVLGTKRSMENTFDLQFQIGIPYHKVATLKEQIMGNKIYAELFSESYRYAF